MAFEPSRQPSVRVSKGHGRHMPSVFATSLLTEGQTVVTEGDKVQLLTFPANEWVDGIVEEIPLDAHGAPAGSVLVSCSSGTELVPADETLKRIKKAARISLLAPGGGVSTNSVSYMKLDQDPRVDVEVIGRKSTLYDRYPEGWPGGQPPPNLSSFGLEVIDIGIPERTDCFIFGSRAGQIVLPLMWQALDNEIPPSVVINGGCAMKHLPGTRVAWPDQAVTIMLLGGLDFFKGSASSTEYLRDACECVSPRNRSTALLYISEMEHMPQHEILSAVLDPMVLAALSWRTAPHDVPIDFLQMAVDALEQGQWGGKLIFTVGPGKWRVLPFGPQLPDRPPKALSPRGPVPPQPAPIRPLGTAVAVIPLHAAINETPEGHRQFAAQARLEAEEHGANADGWERELRLISPTSPDVAQLRCKISDARSMQQRLSDFADGQEGEAYAAEFDAAKHEAWEKFKAQKIACNSNTVQSSRHVGQPARSAGKAQPHEHHQLQWQHQPQHHEIRQHQPQQHEQGQQPFIRSMVSQSAWDQHARLPHPAKICHMSALGQPPSFKEVPKYAARPVGMQMPLQPAFQPQHGIVYPASPQQNLPTGSRLVTPNYRIR